MAEGINASDCGKMKALLDNLFAPITFHVGFVECRFDQLARAFTVWQEEIDEKLGTRTETSHSSASLPDALLKLEPLTTPLDRYLLIETRSAWTAVFSNGLSVNDVFSPVSYLPTLLGCRGLEVTSIPDRSDNGKKDGLQVYGALVFGLYGSKTTDWLNRIRRIAVTKDVNGWEFSADGEIQPYERAENYRKRNAVDRFTVDMLESYCGALGIEVFEARFYGGQNLVSRRETTTPPGPMMSIAEARSHLCLSDPFPNTSPMSPPRHH
jgi:hypothetical protein